MSKRIPLVAILLCSVVASDAFARNIVRATPAERVAIETTAGREFYTAVTGKKLPAEKMTAEKLSDYIREMKRELRAMELTGEWKNLTDLVEAKKITTVEQAQKDAAFAEKMDNLVAKAKGEEVVVESNDSATAVSTTSAAAIRTADQASVRASDNHVPSVMAEMKLRRERAESNDPTQADPDLASRINELEAAAELSPEGARFVIGEGLQKDCHDIAAGPGEEVGPMENLVTFEAVAIRGYREGGAEVAVQKGLEVLEDSLLPERNEDTRSEEQRLCAVAQRANNAGRKCNWIQSQFLGTLNAMYGKTCAL